MPENYRSGGQSDRYPEHPTGTGATTMDQANGNSMQQWFSDYAEAVSRFDVDRVTRQYADSYVEAGPGGSVCIRNDDAFREALGQKRELMAGLGFKSAKAISVVDSRLDQNYSMVKVHWQMEFENKPGRRIDAEFDNTYFVRHQGYDARVVGSISHQDEEATMRDLGLLPSRGG